MDGWMSGKGIQSPEYTQQPYAINISVILFAVSTKEFPLLSYIVLNIVWFVFVNFCLDHVVESNGKQ